MKLRDYQEVGVEFLRQHPRAALFLDMGLGKTAVALTALTPDHLPALVVAPKRVAEHVWPAEARRWRPDLKLRVAAGSPEERDAILRSSTADIVVVSRDRLADKGIGSRTYKTVILDELSSFKNKKTNRWRRAVALTQNSSHVWGLTGTPAPNGYLDLWPQIYLLDRGERLGRYITHYRNRYFVAGRQLKTGTVIEWIQRPETTVRVNRLLEDLCLSMGTEGRVSLPPVTFNEVVVPFPPPLMKLYKKYKRDAVLDLELLGGTKHTAATAAALSNRLQQMTAGFNYHAEGTGYDLIHTNKVDAVLEILEGTGSPVLVLYKYKAELEQLLAAIPEAKTLKSPGVLDRWNAGEVPVLIAHPASIGHGLNLQHGGHTAIWTSLTWSLEEWEQTNKRLVRSGQEHPVVIHILTTPGTVDPLVSKALREKGDVQSALLAHLESPV